MFNPNEVEEQIKRVIHAYDPNDATDRALTALMPALLRHMTTEGARIETVGQAMEFCAALSAALGALAHTIFASTHAAVPRIPEDQLVQSILHMITQTIEHTRLVVGNEPEKIAVMAQLETYGGKQ